MDKTALIERAKKYFSRHPRVNKFFVTSDGMFFTDNSPAIDHRDKNNLELFTIDREDIEEKPSKDTQKSSTPDDSWKVDEIKAWLEEQGIEFSHDARKAELLELAEGALTYGQDNVQAQPSSMPHPLWVNKPGSQSTVEEIKHFLDDVGIEYGEEASKEELLKLVQEATTE